MEKSIKGVVSAVRNKIRARSIKSTFKHSLNKATPIIVYQMGKVGSSSVYNSLKEAYPGLVSHKHILTEPGDWEAKMLLDHAIIHKKQVKLISMVRDPVSRNMSAFFQNFEYITGIKPSDSKFSTQEILDIILTHPRMDNNVPLWWFDKNTKSNFGIDVFAQPFDKEKGWIKLSNGTVELLLMKSEISDEVKNELLRDFTGLKDFRLSSHNVSENKEYADMYKTFKNEVKLPLEYLDKLFTAPQVKHFYSDEEIAKFYKKWKR